MATRGGAAPFRSSDGLSTRQVGTSDEIQLRIDPMHADLDNEILGLRSQVRQLRSVAQEIHSEAKFQNDFMNQLQMTLIQVQASMKNNMRRLNRSMVQSGSSHIVHVVLFAMFCLFLVYFWSKLSRHWGTMMVNIFCTMWWWALVISSDWKISVLKFWVEF